MLHAVVDRSRHNDPANFVAAAAGGPLPVDPSHTEKGRDENWQQRLD